MLEFLLRLQELFMKKKKKIHFAWFVLFMCCCFYGSTAGLYTNTVGLYTAYILKDMGWSYTLLTLMGLAMTASRTIASRFAAWMFNKLPLKPVLIGSIILANGGSCLKCYMQNAAAYIAMCVLVGIGGAFLFFVPIPMLIRNWFAEKRDTVMGIAMITSGLFAAVFSPVINHWIDLYGWRYASVLNGVVAMAMAIPPVLLFGIKTPEEKGLEPYRWKEKASPSQPPHPPTLRLPASSLPDVPEAAEGKTFVPGSQSQAEKKKLLFITIILAIGCYVVSGIPGRFSHYAITAGIGASTGALMLSLSQAGNMIAKLLLGRASTRFGPRKAYLGALYIVLITVIVFTAMPSSKAVLLIFAFLAGITSANSVMLYPAAVRVFSGSEEYASNISKVSMPMVFICSVVSLGISRVYDVTVNYFYVYLINAIIAVICIVTASIVFPRNYLEDRR